MIVIRWNQRRIEKNLMVKVNKLLRQAGLILELAIKKLISKGNVDGKSPSRPGQPPKVRTGTLRASIGIKQKKLVVFIGVIQKPASAVAKKYASALEFGYISRSSSGRIRALAPRPYLRPSLKRNKRKILKLFGAK